MKCPNCGEEMAALNNNQNYLLSQLDSNNSLEIGTGLLVQALGCVNCGCIILHNPSICGAKVTKNM